MGSGRMFWSPSLGRSVLVVDGLPTLQSDRDYQLWFVVDGEQQVKIHGQLVAVNARIERLDSMSAHADSDEILKWLRTAPRAPKMTYLVHGEAPAQEALRARIGAEIGWPVHIPAHAERVDLPL